MKKVDLDELSEIADILFNLYIELSSFEVQENEDYGKNMLDRKIELLNNSYEYIEKVGERLKGLSTNVHDILRNYKVRKELHADIRRRVKERRAEKEKPSGKGKGWHGDPERHSKAAKTGKADFIIAEIGDINDLRFDSIDLSNFIQTTDDSISDEFTVLHGAITRSGDFPYIKNGKWVTYVKEWDNIKETFSRYSYIPLKASVEKGSHHAKILGYLANWNPHEDTEEMYADFVLFDKIENLTKVLNPKEGYHVSLGYPDVIKNGNRQILLGLDHGALSLGNKDTGRACYGSNSKGASCTKVRIVNHDQQIEEVMA